MQRWLLAVVAACGCGRLSFEPRALDAAAIDAPFPTGAFATPVPIAELNSPETEDDPSMTADGLEIFFMSFRDGTERLYRATRASTADPWSTPMRVLDIDGSNGQVNNTKISPDGLTLVFSSSNKLPNQGMADLWIATRVDRQSPWSLRPLSELSTPLGDIEPFLTPDGLVLYFNSNRDGAANGDIYVATRMTPDDLFGTPQRVAELSTDGYDGGIFTADGGRLALMHNPMNGDLDLVMATRASIDEPFGPMETMPVVNSPVRDQDPWLSLDGHTLIFASDRDDPLYDLYITTR